MSTDRLPAHIRRAIETAIYDALHPKGLTVWLGVARVDVSHLRYLMRLIDETQKPDEGK